MRVILQWDLILRISQKQIWIYWSQMIMFLMDLVSKESLRILRSSRKRYLMLQLETRQWIIYWYRLVHFNKDHIKFLVRMMRKILMNWWWLIDINRNLSLGILLNFKKLKKCIMISIGSILRTLTTKNWRDMCKEII